MNTSDVCDALLVEHLPVPRPSLRVAVVTETYPPEVNGVAVTLQQLVQRLQAGNHQIQLIRPRQPLTDKDRDACDDELLVRGLEIPRYPQLRLGMPIKRALLAQWSRQRPDLVHVATEGPLGWSAVQAARKLRLPLSTDFRTNFHAYSQHYGIGWLRKPIAAYLRKFHNLADCTMVPSSDLLHDLSAQGFERLMVVARGVDTARFSPVHRSEALRAQWGAAPDQPVLLSVGRLAREKNLDLLTRSWNAMRAVRPDLKLVVVGDGPSRNALAQACPEALMVGAQSGDDLARHYASADLFVFPSVTETYGNVTPEALASGLAVLAFDYAAAAELIRHGDNGLLAPRGDETAFLQNAVDLISNPGLVEHLRERGRATTLTQDWGQIARQVEGVWHQLLAVRQPVVQA
ncbi:glycosyltransferase family 4 protein [Hydrogenophaga sp. PBL-H3]|uniref:glycosyltransferase family 4 protein n=1 Tax=Hydrogenophaga sp. PBL-H3 TaxID=434010 RepID=UPI00131FBBD6|nr:glycosyltransferase family 1 protein [Hydrogenophaga sp. PBL-H3]QHE77156.1 glycosyltransferase family 1 protein [Hydrogenophaga sp. PBL-H3]QHE81580.1 glycosyltransferase family 1 protein [Hydrogenophaga sp. PBL-H3]